MMYISLLLAGSSVVWELGCGSTWGHCVLLLTTTRSILLRLCYYYLQFEGYLINRWFRFNYYNFTQTSGMLTGTTKMASPTPPRWRHQTTIITQTSAMTRHLSRLFTCLLQSSVPYIDDHQSADSRRVRSQPINGPDHVQRVLDRVGVGSGVGVSHARSALHTFLSCLESLQTVLHKTFVCVINRLTRSTETCPILSGIRSIGNKLFF